ncbi:MAG: insulinase family protein, partial [Odoribacter sp.]|nr:insulinase family protein [Odoribacter sp.]
MKKILFLLLLTATFVWQAFASGESFRHGHLDNGLHYYIRANRTTPGKADFYLVQNVGALMEEDHQNGLAHVLEHMAFHATENFPEGAPAFLKRRGIQDLNAYTGADETVYHIDGVPTDDKGLVDSCILILHDWSGFLLLRADEMEIERKVILEERRQGMALSQRMQTKLNALLSTHSKYATHDVIGTPEVLHNFTAEEVRAYYRDFYRPDQQAVIIIGDIDPEAVEAEVKRLFAPIPKRVNPKARLTYHIPDNTEPLYCRLIDKDIPQNAIVLMQRFRKAPVNSLKTQIKEQLCSEFYNQLVGSYLNDFIQEEDANFLSAQAGVHSMVRHYEGQNIAVTPLPGMEKEALRQVLEQLERIRRYGITEQKMKGLTDNYRRSLQQSAAMLNRMPNSV